MTNRQLNNTVGMIKFSQNIGKLSVGRTTSFYRDNMDGSETLIGKVRCDTYGERPRKFTITNSDILPVGGGYSLKSINKKLFDLH